MILRSVLAATDLSVNATAVLRTAAALAKACGAELHVVHAFDLDLSAYPEAMAATHTFQGRIETARHQLDREIGGAVPGDVEVTSREVVIYTAHRAILDRALQVEAGLIVLGAHHGRRALGTTADRVIRSAPCPCLIVRAPLAIPPGRVVVPLDLSQPSRGALDVALAWIAGLGGGEGDAEAELDVVHVIPRAFESGGLPVNRATIEPRVHTVVETALAAHPRRPRVREELVWGNDPAGEIVRFAADRGAGLLVMATHGHGALHRALIGSVSSAVARRADTPVLLVPPSRWSGWSAEPAEPEQTAALATP